VHAETPQHLVTSFLGHVQCHADGLERGRLDHEVIQLRGIRHGDECHSVVARVAVEEHGLPSTDGDGVAQSEPQQLDVEVPRISGVRDRQDHVAKAEGAGLELRTLRRHERVCHGELAHEQLEIVSRGILASDQGVDPPAGSELRILLDREPRGLEGDGEPVEIGEAAQLEAEVGETGLSSFHRDPVGALVHPQEEGLLVRLRCRLHTEHLGSEAPPLRQVGRPQSEIAERSHSHGDLRVT